MTDPYKILNISESASDEEIKKVYRELAKKYHPDKYANSPLAEQASEKMKEINAAYEQIIEERKNRTSPNYSQPDYAKAERQRRFVSSSESTSQEADASSAAPSLK